MYSNIEELDGLKKKYKDRSGEGGTSKKGKEEGT